MSSKKPTITITFKREDDSHRLKVEGVSGREMIIATQTMMRNVEQNAGMPFELCAAMAALEEEKSKGTMTDEEYDQAVRDFG